MTPIAALVLIAAPLCLLAGCKDEPTTPTAPTTTTPTIFTEHFVGSLSVGGSHFQSFMVAQSGTITATLASVTSPRTGAPVDVALGIGIGRPEDERCSILTSTTSGSGLNAQVQFAATSGSHCIAIYDVARLTGDINFAIRFSHP